MLSKPQNLNEVKEYANKIVDHAIYQLNRNDSIDCEFGCAYELIDLIELMTPNYNWHYSVAKEVLDMHNWVKGTSKHIKEYFDLPY